MTVVQKYQAAIAQLSQDTGIPFSCDAETVARASKDFGNIVHGQSHGVVQPRNAHDVAALLKMANRDGLAIALRGNGCSQGGQSVSQGGITLDTSRLDCIEILESDFEQVLCGAGTTWRQLVAHLGGRGLLPCVMPLNLNLTVGGTLSAGGFGANSHRFGSAIANVAGLEAISGTGDLISCNALEKSDLFEAILGGQGRCAVISSALLRLRPIKSQVRTYYLLYEDFNLWLDDQQHLALSDQIDYLEGFCSASAQGLRKTTTGRCPLVHWLYGLHVSVEFEPSHPPQAEQILEGLRYNRLLHTDDDATVAYMARYDLRFQTMQQSGAWQQPHPWFDCILPLDVASEVIPQILDLLPSFFGDGHRVILLGDRETSRFFIRPDRFPACLFAILPTGIPESLLSSALAALSDVNDLVIRYGGKRYLSGWLGTMTPQTWTLHFGHQYDDWQRLKQLYDPNHVLCSALFP
jgi:cytokinin dehydrogenase